jgi:hypothetical protein
MKQFLEQGVAVSKDLGEKGYQASREFLNKAGAKAQDLGERGVLLLEIKQLESRAQKLLARLGTEVYRTLVEESAPTVSAEDPAIKPLLAELAGIRDSIEKREADLQSRK